MTEASPIGVSGAVLAGGASVRMGMDKRSLPVAGVPLLRRAALAVAAVADELLVVCRASAPPEAAVLEGLDARLVHDRLDGEGPLAGLEAALAAARGELVLVVAADMPWLEPAVLRVLVATAAERPAADAVALRTERGPEPLVAVYRRRALPAVTALLERGTRRAHAALEALAAEEVPPEAWRVLDATGRTPDNVNTLADLARAAGAAAADPGAPGAQPARSREPSA